MRIRLVCRRCGNWIETTNEGMVALTAQGFPPDSPVEQLKQATLAMLIPFLDHHRDQCGCTPTTIHETDQRFAYLPPEKRTDAEAS